MRPCAAVRRARHYDGPPRQRPLLVAGEERSTAVFREAESPVQQRGEDLSSETRAFEHVKTAGKILEARQPRSVSTSRQLGELARQAERQEIALDELGRGRATESRAAGPQPSAATSWLRPERRTHGRFAALERSGGLRTRVRITPTSPRDAYAVQPFRASIVHAAAKPRRATQPCSNRHDPATTCGPPLP